MRGGRAVALALLLALRLMALPMVMAAGALDLPGLTMPAPRERAHATRPAASHAVRVPEPRGGHDVTLHAGVDLTPKQGLLKGHLIGLELGVPIYQDLNGVQSKTDWTLAMAWRKPF